MMPFKHESVFIQPATITPIDVSQYVPPWPWPRSLPDDELEIFKASLNPHVTLIRACTCGTDLYYTARFPMVAGHVTVDAAYDNQGHRYVRAHTTD